MDALLFPRRRRLLAGALGAVALAGCGELRPGARRTAPLVRFAGETMGSTYTVKIAHAALAGERAEALRAAVHETLSGVDRRMSLFRADSELARLNRHDAHAPLVVSPHLFAVLAVAREVSEVSAGAFDVTVEPLVSAWGFGPAPRSASPSQALERPAAVDYRALQLDAAAGTIVKSRAGVRADLGGIAAGYGVDRAALALDERGIEHYMIEVSGEVRTRGLNAAGEPWRIGVEEPDAGPRRARAIVPLSGGAMATSGDYRSWFEHGGRRYCHEIDPRIGRPIAHALCSVTVVAADAVRADALSTALIVAGPERGRALAERLGLAAYFVERTPGGALRDAHTSAFARLRPTLGA